MNKKIIFDGDMIEVPASFLFKEEYNELTWREKSVYLFILGFKKVMGRDPARSDFRMYTGIALTASKDIVKKLETMGLLEVKYRKVRGSSGVGYKANNHILKAW
jgi:hypothetical protein